MTLREAAEAAKEWIYNVAEGKGRGKVYADLVAALSAPEPPVEGWLTFEAELEHQRAIRKQDIADPCPMIARGEAVHIAKPVHDQAHRAIAQAEAARGLAEAARRIVAHWQIVSAPATARGISTMGSLTADMEMALAAWEAAKAIIDGVWTPLPSGTIDGVTVADPRLQAAEALAEAARVYRLTAGAENRGMPSDVCVEAEAAFDAALAAWEGEMAETGARNERLTRLYKEFREKEFRHEYVNGYFNTLVAYQIRALREGAGLLQADLAEALGTKQSRVSTFEDPDYGSWNIKTLRRLAEHFDVGLSIKFENFGRLLTEMARFDSESVKAPFKDDPVFKTDP